MLWFIGIIGIFILVYLVNKSNEGEVVISYHTPSAPIDPREQILARLDPAIDLIAKTKHYIPSEWIDYYKEILSIIEKYKNKELTIDEVITLRRKITARGRHLGKGTPTSKKQNLGTPGLAMQVASHTLGIIQHNPDVSEDNLVKALYSAVEAFPGTKEKAKFIKSLPDSYSIETMNNQLQYFRKKYVA